MGELGREFFAPPALEVAPRLLNKVLVTPDGLQGRIVEVEAYEGADDPASHGHRGPTARTATMFGPPGHLYVYFVYGMHWCANVVCGAEGVCSAVLLRGLEPLAGIETMRARRPPSRGPATLCDGPAKLCQALGIDGSHDGLDLVAPNGIRVVDDGTPPPDVPLRTPRIGVSTAATRPWRFVARAQ